MIEVVDELRQYITCTHIDWKKMATVLKTSRIHVGPLGFEDKARVLEWATKNPKKLCHNVLQIYDRDDSLAESNPSHYVPPVPHYQPAPLPCPPPLLEMSTRAGGQNHP